MSETTDATETQTQDAAPQTDESKPAETDWKAEARKWESRAKANHDAARQLAELQDASAPMLRSWPTPRPRSNVSRVRSSGVAGQTRCPPTPVFRRTCSAGTPWRPCVPQLRR